MNILCRLHIHTSSYLDGAWIFEEKRCNHCNQWLGPYGRYVDRERELYEQGYDRQGVWGLIFENRFWNGLPYLKIVPMEENNEKHDSQERGSN